MQHFSNYNDAEKALLILNKRLYNAGYYFKVVDADDTCVYVQGSFNFAYYVNVHFEFNQPLFTSLQENDNWSDAWHDNQLRQLSKSDIKEICQSNHVEYPESNEVFGFQFNVTGYNNLTKAIIICSSLSIRWEHPYNDLNPI